VRKIEAGHYADDIDGVVVTVKRYWAMTMRQPGQGRAYKSSVSGWRARIGAKGPETVTRTKRMAIQWIKERLIANT
jgi:hypothetical protein